MLGAANVPINLGRKSRVFTGAARDAAKLLAIQCDHLGCGLPADLCQIDHSTEWHENGPTDQDNAGVDCGGHNREKHRKRWRTRRDIHGRRYTIRADGTIILPAGARAPTFPDDPAPPARDAIREADPRHEIRHEHGDVDDLDRRLDDWVVHADDDIDRRCRTLRAVAIRAAASHGDQIHVGVLSGPSSMTTR